MGNDFEVEHVDAGTDSPIEWYSRKAEPRKSLAPTGPCLLDMAKDEGNLLADNALKAVARFPDTEGKLDDVAERVDDLETTVSNVVEFLDQVKAQPAAKPQQTKGELMTLVFKLVIAYLVFTAFMFTLYAVCAVTQNLTGIPIVSGLGG